MDWEFNYCKFYCIVLHNMLFLIDFLKKDVNFFSSFLVYFHTICVLYMYGDLCPHSDSSGSQHGFKNKKVNKSEDAILFLLPTGIYLIDYYSTFPKPRRKWC